MPESGVNLLEKVEMKLLQKWLLKYLNCILSHNLVTIISPIIIIIIIFRTRNYPILSSPRPISIIKFYPSYTFKGIWRDWKREKETKKGGERCKNVTEYSTPTQKQED